MKKFLVLLALPILILISILACNLPAQITGQSGAIPIAQQWVTVAPNATATPTPFLPQTATPQPLLTPTSIEPTLTPTVTPIPWEIIPADGQVNILVLGSDWRPGAGYRTDVILLVSLNPKLGTASLVSFPRDLYVDIPGRGKNRINTAHPAGGFPLTVATFQQNFGITIDYYVLTNFQGFVNIVDSLGGIDVYAAKNLTDQCKLPQAQNGYCSVGPGLVHMDGQTALWYVRSRYSTSDFDRTRREQEVLIALFNKLMSLNAIARAPELYEYYRSSVETNLPLDVALSLAPLAPQLLADPSRIQRFTIGPGLVTPYTTESGAYVLIPNVEAIREILRQALNAQ